MSLYFTQWYCMWQLDEYIYIDFSLDKKYSSVYDLRY